MNDQEHKEFMQNEAPLLSSLKRKSSEGVPEGYFESFPERMMDRIQNLEKEESRVLGFDNRSENGSGFAYYRIAAVVSILILCSVGAFMFLNRGNAEYAEDVSWASVTKADVLNEIDINELDEDELIAMIDESDFEKVVESSGSFSNEVEILKETTKILDDQDDTDTQFDDSDFEGIDIEDIDSDLLNELLEE